MTAIKTVEYAFPVLASLSDNTLTALTQITVYLPEGSKVFKKVKARVTATDLITVTGGTIASTQVQVSVGGATATNVTNTDVTTNTGENIAIDFDADFTAHFVSNWTSGTSKTLDCSVLIDQSTGTTLGWANVCVTVLITYEYDETSATHVKTVWIPLDAEPDGLAATKGSAIDTIPNLSTYCPEASKTFRQINIVIQGNMGQTGTSDKQIRCEVGSGGTQSMTFEAALSTSLNFRAVFQGQTFSTSSSHSFYMWANTADTAAHMQAYLVVTYEFDPSTSTRCLQSVWLGGMMAAEIGRTTSSDYISVVNDLWIQEPGTISDGRVALFVNWSGISSPDEISARLGAGSFVQYDNGLSGGTFSGHQALMCRNDSAFTLARGRNTLTADIYNTDSADGDTPTACWLVCYTADKPSAGVHAANKSVMVDGLAKGTQAAADQQRIATTLAVSIPEASYCTQSCFAHVTLWTRLAKQGGLSIALYDTDARIERVAEPVGRYLLHDEEVGAYRYWLPLTRHVKRWAGDPLADRHDLESSTLKLVVSTAMPLTNAWWELWLTYHAITFTVAGDVTDSGGGVVDLTLHRASDGEQLASTSRTGDGAYSMTWYDDTEDVYVVGHEDATHVGASAPDTAA